VNEPSPLEPPPLPPVRRLTRAVWIAAALVACITVFVVLFVAGPRKSAMAAFPAPRPLAGSDPGFLQHPAGELPAGRPAPQRPRDYMDDLVARKAAAGGGAPPGEGPAGRDAAGEEAPGAGAAGVVPAAGPARPPAPPADRRREAFERALAAPLARSASNAAAAREAEAEGLARWLAPLRGGAPAADGLSAPEASASAVTPAGAAVAGTGWTAGGGLLPASPGAANGQGRAASSAVLEATRSGGGVGPLAGRAGWPAVPGQPGGAGSQGAGPGARLPVRFHPRPGSWTVPAGTVIPALLLTEVNSDLPGNLLAQVSRDVYDFRQEVVLIPAGTRLLGRYDSQVALGQSRMVVAWTRVVLPDGSGFDLPGLPGVDAGGAAGLGGRVDRHVLRTFGDALLLSLLAAGAQLSQPQASGFGTAPGVGNVAAAALGQELSAAGLELLHRDISIQPTLRLPAATSFLVFVNGDLDLAPVYGASGGSGENGGAARGGPHGPP
jgi:type IV secretory pathway VirB10-like protein